VTGAIQVVAALLWHNGRVLLGQRPAGSPDAGRWEFPGGKREPDESPEAALARELAEELGIGARVGALLGETSFEPDHARPPIQLEFYAVEITAGVPEPRHHQALRWVHPAELEALDLLPGDRAFARRLAGGGGVAGSADGPIAPG
jgi:8-oxo-dGTP diphosphatase